MAIVEVQGSPSVIDIVKSLKPAEFDGIVTASSTSIAYHLDETNGDYYIKIDNVFGGNFAYTYGPNSQVTKVTGTVTSLSYDYAYKDYTGESKPFSEGLSVSDINIDVSDFQTMTADAIFKKILSGNDTIYGSYYNDYLYGDAGNDVLYGRGGNDVLNGGTGADVMVGGNGNTSYSVDNPFDAVIEFFGGGSDTVHSSIDYVLGQAVDNLELETTAKSATGNELSNRIVGASNDNVLDGRDGNDDLRGNDGDDTLIGGRGNDKLMGGRGADKLDGGDGVDIADYSKARIKLTASLLSSAINTGDAQGDTYKAIENVRGGNYSDLLSGNNVANTIYGGEGSDTLTGYNGNDHLYGEIGNDTLIGGAGADVLSGGIGMDRASYAGATAGVIASLANASINTGDAAGDIYDQIENLTGSSHHDYLYGNGANNIIIAGAGNDILKGYAGNDQLYGGAGNDAFIFNTALNVTTNIDVIHDFDTLHDTIWLDNSVFKSLKTGALPANAFRLAGEAPDAADRIIYDPTTGKVSYDVDGAGGKAIVQFAFVSENLAVTYKDFIIV